MKPVIIIVIAFVLLIPITAFAQSSEESLSNKISNDSNNCNYDEWNYPIFF